MASQISILAGKYRAGVPAEKGEGISPLPQAFSPEAVAPVAQFHQSIPQYEKTPLVSLPELARRLGVGHVLIKDESRRFGLNAFKGLGASYAVAKILSKLKETGEKKLTFVTATDGNHGKGVAWAASIFGCRAIVFMPKGSKTCRAEAIRSINGTRVEITEFNYDDTVRMAAEFSRSHGYYLVQDTGFEGYEEIPTYITQGYTTMAAEAVAQLAQLGISKPTHVFLQAGVGSMAGGVLGYLAHAYGGKPPITTIVEPSTVACLYESAKAGDGKPHAIGGHPETIMAGLNCGEPNPLVWPVLRDYAAFYAACPDWVTELGMFTLAHPLGQDPRVVSGESGAVGLGLLAALCQSPEYGSYRSQMQLDQQAAILLFSTEGDTDPESYQDITTRKLDSFLQGSFCKR